MTSRTSRDPAEPAGLLKSVELAWPTNQWRGVHVLVAVSGGPDSMAMLRTLETLHARTGGAGRLLPGHVNHGLRSSADADQNWLSRECQRLGMELHVRSGDAAALAATDGDGVEAAARKLRYGLLTAMAESVGARFVAVGHTLDDQVETVLFRLARGSGIRGLSGMPFTRPLSPSVSLVRPLLQCRRADVVDYLSELGQRSLDDPSNANLDFRRNCIRSELLPMLRARINRDVDGAVWRLSQQAAEVDAYLESQAEALLAAQQAVIRPNEGFLLAVDSLSEPPALLVREALRLAWRRSRLPEGQMDRRWWNRLASLARVGGQERLSLPGDVQAMLCQGFLSVTRRSDDD